MNLISVIGQAARWDLSYAGKNWILTPIILVLFVVSGPGCRTKQKTSYPAGWETIPRSPQFGWFNPNEITAATRELLGMKQGAVAFISMDSAPTERELLEIIDGMRDIRSRREPMVCISRNEAFIVESLVRTLTKYPDVNLSGLQVVVAAPREPNKEFVSFLQGRKLEYHFLQIQLGHRPEKAPASI